MTVRPADAATGIASPSNPQETEVAGKPNGAPQMQSAAAPTVDTAPRPDRITRRLEQPVGKMRAGQTRRALGFLDKRHSDVEVTVREHRSLLQITFFVSLTGNRDKVDAFSRDLNAWIHDNNQAWQGIEKADRSPYRG
ncbi:MAG: hypothetical protein AAFY60_11675 [Myxococcota bacterium]